LSEDQRCKLCVVRRSMMQIMCGQKINDANYMQCQKCHYIALSGQYSGQRVHTLCEKMLATPAQLFNTLLGLPRL
jgi:hypothetical protein